VTPKRQISTDSLRAIATLSHEDQAEREQLESAVVTWHTRLEEAKWPAALQIFENASYLLGNHYTRYFYDPTNGFGYQQFSASDKSKYDSIIAKCADNQLIRPTETVVGMLTEARPEPRVEPNSEDPADEDAAALGELFLQTTFEYPIRMPALRREAAMMAALCGMVAAETEYGPTGDPVEVPKFKVVKKKNLFYDPKDPEMGPEHIEEQVPDGHDVESRWDFMCRLYTLMNLAWDPTATREQDLGWISRTTYEDIDWIRENFDKKEDGYYPENLGAIETQDCSRHTLFWWTKFQDILEAPQHSVSGGMSPSAYLTTNGQAPNQVPFTVVDVRPSRAYPRGRTLILAGGKLIYCSPKEFGSRAWSEKYPNRWHGYAFFHWFKLPGRFRGVPLLSFLVPLQKKINAIDAIVHANRQHIGVGQWLIPKQAKLAEGRISAFHGEHYTYVAVPGIPAPERIQNHGLPQDLLIERSELIRSIEGIAASGVVDTKDVSASAARSGAMLDFLRSEKLRSKAPTIQAYEEFLEAIGQNLLIECQLHLVEDSPDITARLRQAARGHSSLTVQTFTGASLRDHHSVRIDIASELRHSQEAMRQAAIEFLQARQGQATPAEINAVMRALRLDKFVKSEQDASISRARRMISRLKAGMLEAFLPMEGIDDPAAMAPEFQREILSDTFLDQPEEVQKIMLVAFDHYSGLAAQAAAAMREQMLQEALLLKGGGAAPAAA
jgi:hypothetical protein